ncbi:MAG TPA: MaoC family dehydratase N-terminal domain-containing protein [Pseudonocardia sp.]|uniref:FAS1-like dehydratase domain-containing protein n=1 Tax=Pseudonocardia sp. TaxID=60912 RepID=UPI002F3EDD6E
MSGLANCLRGWSPAPLRWSGRLSGWSVAAFAGLLDQPSPLRQRPVVPPMWQLFGCLPHPAQAQLGADGHPAEGPFLPPIPDRRRMFAGGRWQEPRPLVVDQPIDCRSEILSTEVKVGRSGEMAFVTVRTEFSQHGELAVAEEQDIVYRGQPRPQPGGLPPVDEQVEEPVAEHELTVLPDPPLLFRFSALTYNTHRIHYDQAYVTGVEGYPGLVVHGPLLALLALELPRRHLPGLRVEHFSYRLRRPAFAGSPVKAWMLPEQDQGERSLVVGVPGGAPSLTGSVRLRPDEAKG